MHNNYKSKTRNVVCKSYTLLQGMISGAQQLLALATLHLTKDVNIFEDEKLQNCTTLSKKQQQLFALLL